MSVKLVEVDKKNWYECAKLELPSHQARFLASNIATIAESKFEKHYVLRAIMNDDILSGMLAYCQEIDEPTPNVYWLFRIMVDYKQQGKGVARKAITLACKEMLHLGATIIRTMHNPDNVVANNLYKSLGFQEACLLDDGDVMLELYLLSESMSSE